MICQHNQPKWNHVGYGYLDILMGPEARICSGAKPFCRAWCFFLHNYYGSFNPGPMNFFLSALLQWRRDSRG